jgi:hypothetical protein
MMLTDVELTKMLRISKDAKIELSLFVGPRAGYDATPQPFTAAGKVIGGNLRGGSQLLYAGRGREARLRAGPSQRARRRPRPALDPLRAEEVRRAPANLVLKISILLPVPNPATAHVLESLGAGTINVSPDLSLATCRRCGGRLRAARHLRRGAPTASAATSAPTRCRR